MPERRKHVHSSLAIGIPMNTDFRAIASFEFRLNLSRLRRPASHRNEQRRRLVRDHRATLIR